MDAIKASLIFYLVILVTSGIGCRSARMQVVGDDSEVQQKAQTNTPAPDVQPPSTGLKCPTSHDLSVDRSHPVIEHSVALMPWRRMVWRKNCDGQIYSKTYENLSLAQTQFVALRSNQNVKVSAFNRTTCSSWVSSDFEKDQSVEHLRIPVSLRTTSQILTVKRGLNVIDLNYGNKRETLLLTVIYDRAQNQCVVIRDTGCQSSQNDQTSHLFR